MSLKVLIPQHCKCKNVFAESQNFNILKGALSKSIFQKPVMSSGESRLFSAKKISSNKCTLSKNLNSKNNYKLVRNKDISKISTDLNSRSHTE